MLKISIPEDKEGQALLNTNGQRFKKQPQMHSNLAVVSGATFLNN